MKKWNLLLVLVLTLGLVVIGIGCGDDDDDDDDTIPQVGGIEGTVMDAETEAALEGATVTLQMDGASIADVTATTDENGAYEMNDIDAGTYTITATLAGYAQGSQEVTVETDQVATADFMLEASEPGSISGTVTDERSGDPIQGAEVNYGDGSVMTGADGTYEIAEMSPGSYNLTVSYEYYGEGTATVDVVASEDTVQDFALTLDVTGAMTGTWLSTGDNLAPLLAGEPFNLDSVIVTFNADQSIELLQHVEGGAWTTSNGLYALDVSEGLNIHTFTGTYTDPISFVQEGIIRVAVQGDPDVLTLEAVQTDPDIGAEVPTPEGGFGSTIIGDINVQTYVRYDADAPEPTIHEKMVGTWLSAGDDVAPLLQGEPFNLDSIYVSFGADQTILLRQHVAGGAWTESHGVWEVDVMEGTIHAFTGTYTDPIVFTQEGIIMVDTDEDPDMLMLEAVQTDPDIGAEVPTVEGGFGSTAIGAINVQTYRKQ